VVDTNLLITVKMNLNQAKKDLAMLKQESTSLINNNKTMIPDISQKFKDSISGKGNLSNLKAQTIEAEKYARFNEDTFLTLKKEVGIQNDIKTNLGTNNNIYKEQALKVTELKDTLGLTNSQMIRLTQNTKRFNFDFLTLLFTGKMLTSTFGGMFKSIIAGYKNAVGLNSVFTKSVSKLSASWSYLKFSIANALNSPFVTSVIDFFISQIELVADFLADNPTLSTVILGVIGALAVIGTLASIASGVIQIGLMAGAFTKLGAALFGGKLIENLKSFCNTIKNDYASAIEFIKTNGLNVLSGALNIGGLTLSIVDLVKNIKSQDWSGVIGDAIATGLFTAGVISSFFSPALGLSLFIYGTATLFLTKISVDERSKVKALEELGIKKESSDFSNWLGSILTSINLALDPNSMPLFTSSVKEGLAKVREDYSKTQEDITNLTKKSTDERNKLTEKEFVDYQIQINGLKNNLTKLYAQGISLDENDSFKTFVENLNITADAQDTFKTKISDSNNELTLMKQKISEYDTVELFKGVDLDKLEQFKKDLVDINTPLATFTVLLNGENGLYASLLNINSALSQDVNLIKATYDFNNIMVSANNLMPIYNTNLNNEKTAMDNLATSTNNAAIAQERLNKARNANTSIKILGKEIVSYSTTTK
jgi:hypothetical protein